LATTGVVYADGNNNGVIEPTEILEEHHYYPFGLEHQNYSTITGNTGYKYTFGGKEFQPEKGMNMYDFGARNYDPALGRWMNIDPLAENSRRWTPYNYAYNNPIFFIDPDGMQSYVFNGKAAQDFARILQELIRDGEDIFVSKGDKGRLNVQRINTGENTPNRLFVHDPEATSKTPNRYERDGKFYFQQMIPSSEYSDDDYKPINGSLKNPSQFDKDRGDYIWKSGVDYSDSSWYERLGESISDDPVTSQDVQTVISRRNSGNSKVSYNLGAKKGFQGGKQKDRDKSIFNYPQDFRRWFHRQYKKSGDKDATKEELQDIYREWKSLGSPKSK